MKNMLLHIIIEREREGLNPKQYIMHAVEWAMSHDILR